MNDQRTKSLNVQSYQDARDVAAIAMWFEENSEPTRGSYSHLVWLLFQYFMKTHSISPAPDHESALEILQHFGFSMAQLNDARGGGARKAMRLEAIHSEQSATKSRADEIAALLSSETKESQ